MLIGWIETDRTKEVFLHSESTKGENMKIYLRDINPCIVGAWKEIFRDEKDIEISCGNIFAGPKADALISPANSFGWMDGGIDLVYIRRFGWKVQERLQERIKESYYGEILVGQATIIKTDDKDFPFLVSAPTMRVPMNVKGTVNAYLAFRAALMKIANWNTASKMTCNGDYPLLESIICPGLGTDVGQLHPFECAKQMYIAYKEVIKGEVPKFKSLEEACRYHRSMV